MKSVKPFKKSWKLQVIKNAAGEFMDIATGPWCCKLKAPWQEEDNFIFNGVLIPTGEYHRGRSSVCYEWRIAGTDIVLQTGPQDTARFLARISNGYVTTADTIYVGVMGSFTFHRIGTATYVTLYHKHSTKFTEALNSRD